MSSASPGTGILTFLTASVTVIALTYFASRWLSSWQSVQRNGRRLRLLDGMQIARDRNLLVVAVGKDVLVLGTSSNGVNLLYRLDEAAADEMLSDSVSQVGSEMGRTQIEQSVRASLDRLRSLLDRSGDRKDV